MTILRARSRPWSSVTKLLALGIFVTIPCVSCAPASSENNDKFHYESHTKAPQEQIFQASDPYEAVSVDQFSVPYDDSLFKRSEKSIALEGHIDEFDELGACYKGKPIVEDVPERFCAPLRCLVSPTTEELVDVDVDPFRPLAKNSDTERQCLEPSGGQARTSRNTQPEVSFIMPVHNGALKAAQSVFEIFRTAREVPSAEFIVVDDGSTEDFTPMHFLIASLKKLFDIDVTLLRSAKNHGFSASVRAGFLRATGKWTIIINSDAFVAKGWLKMLHITAESNPRVGIVGPLFLGDGMIVQEAGGLLFRDGSAANSGRGFRTGPVPARLNHMRVVDYISAACIMIKRSVLLDAGGFLPQSNLYHQGYYEDPDLAMEMRKMGKDVVYQPMSVVFHQEGGTFGTDEDSELKRSLMKRNKEVFYSKWKDDLQRHCAPGSEEIHSQYRLAGGQSVLIVDSTVPQSDRDSGSLRLFNIIRLLLGGGYRVSFRSLDGAPAKNYAELRRLGVQVYPPAPANDWILADSENKCLYDVAVVSRRDIFRVVLETLKSQCPDIPIIYDTVDIHFLREARTAISAIGSARKARWDFSRTSIPYVTKWIEHSRSVQAKKVRSNMQVEMKLVKQADATWIVSRAELGLMKHFGATEDDKISVVSNIHELPPFKTTPSCRTRRGIVFVGNFFHKPNQEAIVTLLRDVLPLVVRTLPRRHLLNFKIHIVGGNSLPPKIGDWVRLQEEKRSFIKFHGFLSDERLRNLYDDIRVVVAPLISGAGVKGKVNDAMKRGIPVVTTPVAAEGMFIVDGRDCMVATTPAEFASKIIQLYTGCDDVWPRMAKNGYESVGKHFSVKAVAPRVMETFRVLGIGPERHSRKSACRDSE